jgi:hypothetical protein
MIYRFFLLFSLLISICISWLLFSYNYLSFLEVLQNTFPDAYDIDKVNQFFSLNQFVFLRIWSLIIISIHLVVFYLMRKYQVQISVLYEALKVEFYTLTGKIIYQIRFQNLEEKITIGLICILIFGHHLYLWTESPIRVDDIGSYVFSAHQGPIVSAFFYHDVNNHIFFNIICSFLDKLPLSPEVVMILPSSLSWMLILVLVYCFARSEAGFRVACIALLLSGLLSSSANYAVQGRGYMLMSLFLLICFFTVYLYCYKERRTIYLVIFVFSSTLAIWTLISSLIAIVPLFIFLGIRSYTTAIKNILYTAIALGFFVALIYIPVLLINGTDRVYNINVKAKGVDYYFSILRPALLESVDCLLGVPTKGYLILGSILVAFFFLEYKKKGPKNWLNFFGIIMIGSFLFITLRTSFPPYRTWTYISFLFNISVAIILVAVIDLFPKKIIIFYSVIIVLAGYCLYPHLGNHYIPKKEYFEEAMKKSKEYSPSSSGIVLVDRRDVLYYYMQLEKIKRKNLFEVVTQKKKNQVCNVVIQYDPFFPAGLYEKDYSFMERFDDCKIYRIK